MSDQTNNPTTQADNINCSICKKEMPKSEGIEKLHGTITVCKDCDAKDKNTQKDGEVCEFC